MNANGDQELLIVDACTDHDNDDELLYIGDESSCCSLSRWSKSIRRRKLCLIPFVLLFIAVVITVGLVTLKASRSGSTSPSFREAAEDMNSTSTTRHHAADRTSSTTTRASTTTTTTTATTPDRTSSTTTRASTTSHQAAGRTTSTTSSTCGTTSCIEAANRLRAAMDARVDPCQDFFEYACGSWNRDNAIPVNQSAFNVFQKLTNELQRNLKELFEDSMERTVGSEAVGKVKTAYSACVNYGSLDTKPLLAILDEMGGWPILKSRYANVNFDLETTIADFRYFNVHVLFGLFVWPDRDDPTVNVINLGQGALVLSSRETYIEPDYDPVLSEYEKVIVAVAVALGAKDYEQLFRDASDIMEFEVELATIMLSAEQRLQKDCNKTTVAGLQRSSGENFNWLNYLRRMFQKAGVEISLSDTVTDCTGSYMKNLMNLIHRTPERTMANFALWQLVLNLFRNLPPKYTALMQDLDKIVRGVTAGQARWSYCVEFVNEHLGSAVGRLYVDKYFNHESKSDKLFISILLDEVKVSEKPARGGVNASTMVHTVLETFYELLDEVTWMDNETRSAAKEKAHAVREEIGYPDSIMDNAALDSYYSELAVNRYNHFDNAMAILKFATKKELGDLHKPVDTDKLWPSPAIVNAMYLIASNEIVFPAGILQPPFFQHDYPSYLEFSGIGAITGHEITHGFDDKSYWFKNNTHVPLWSLKVKTIVEQKAKCFVDQYSKYVVTEVNKRLNGRLTKIDNVADNGGLKLALRAYRKSVARRGQEEPPLPGLDLTREQLFFLNFAQTWCGTARPEYYKQTLQVDTHSPGRYRVIGSVSNSPDFAAAYNCRLGTPMNPRNKCSLW